MPDFFRTLRRYTGATRGAAGAVDGAAALAGFLQSRASYVAQHTLFGYMKTRAGMKFPLLFEDAAMLQSMNIAKWRVYLACLSDLAVYSGVLLRLHAGAPGERVRAVVTAAVEQALAENGAPDDAGDGFAEAAREVRLRIARVDFDALGDDESAFSESPRALVDWAPVVDELKSLDAEIIRNSVRFRWHEIRRELRKRLRAAEVVAA